MKNSSKSEIEKILARQSPSRFVYAPNYWQWFKHQKDHNLVPDEIKHCKTLQDLYTYLNVDIFSRNIYADPEKYWFGGICDEMIDHYEVKESIEHSGKDKVIVKEYLGSEGKLIEKLRFVYNDSTLVQDRFLVTDYIKRFDVFKQFLSNRKWVFKKKKFNNISQSLGENGVVIAGEFFSPLKMLHLTMGPINSVYFLMEYPEQARQLIEIHELAQLSSIKQCVENGVKVIMSMDNLDTMFHPPDYIKEFSASYYQKASAICHAHGAYFFIHACGQQKANLRLISSYQVDGLEGVAFPPLGDVMLDEAMEDTGSSFIITGGISAMETMNLKTREEIYSYVETLFRKMLPYKNRFIFSSSCNTAIDTSWNTIKLFRDAWMHFRDMKV